MIDFHHLDICRNCYFYQEFGIDYDCGTCDNKEADDFNEEVDAEYACYDYEEKDM